MGKVQVLSLVMLPIAIYLGDERFNGSKLSDSALTMLEIANYNIRSSDPDIAAMDSARAGRFGLVQYLVDNKGTNPSFKENEYKGYGLIHHASKAGKLGLVKTLFAKGVSLDERDTQFDNVGMTPLLLAAQHGHGELLRWLVESGADVNIKEYGPPIEASNMALHFVAKRGDLASLSLLLDRGSTVDYKGNGGWSALTNAAHGGHLACVERLVEAGARLDHSDWDLNTPIGRAAAKGRTDVVKYLVEKGAKVTLTNKKGMTPAKLAVEGGHTELAEYIKSVTPDKKAGKKK